MAITKTFTWFPDVGARHKVKPTVKSSRFGDGYEQRTAYGINTLPMTWSVTFTRNRATGQLILAFLRGCKAAEAFNWTNPLSEAGKYVCREWDFTLDRGLMTITCNFEQVFET